MCPAYVPGHIVPALGWHKVQIDNYARSRLAPSAFLGLSPQFDPNQANQQRQAPR
jgi:hypothetical protein